MNEFQLRHRLLKYHMESNSDAFLVQHARVAGNIANRVYNSYKEYRDACMEFGIAYAEKWGIEYFDTVD